MARRRNITSDMSADDKLAELGDKAGTLAILLYTWMIPHAEDDATLHGTPRQIKLKVLPGIDCTAQDVEKALEAMLEIGLIEWDREHEVIGFPPEAFYRYQTYIPPSRRRAQPLAEYLRSSDEASADQRNSPQSAAEERTSAQKAASPSLSLSLTPSHSLTREGTTPAIAPPPGEPPAPAPGSEQVAAAGGQAQSTEPKPISREPKFGPGDPPYELAVHLRREILARDPRTKVPPETPAGLARWSKDADLLLRLDQRPFEEARQVASFAAADPFWSQNILSVKKLRAHYDQLRKRMQVQGQAQTRASPYAAPPARAQPKSITDTAEERRRRLAALG